MPTHDRKAEDERVSLAPLDPVAALRALLRVDPDAKSAEDHDEEDEGPVPRITPGQPT